ncbi:hypothetical protein ACWIGI_22085 [Nocardia sp. NPDC055321]
MRVMTLLKSAADFGMPPAELFDALAEFGAEATKAGVLAETAGLTPTAGSTLITLTGGEISTTNGFDQPVSETVAAYAIYEVETVEEAAEWGFRFAELHRKHWPAWEGRIEVRQTFGS